MLKVSWSIVGAVVLTAAAFVVARSHQEADAELREADRRLCDQQRADSALDCEPRIVSVSGPDPAEAFARLPCGWRWAEPPQVACQWGLCTFVGVIESIACDDAEPSAAELQLP